MMVNMRRRHDATFKARVAAEVVRGEKAIAQIGLDSVHDFTLL